MLIKGQHTSKVTDVRIKSSFLRDVLACVESSQTAAGIASTPSLSKGTYSPQTVTMLAQESAVLAIAVPQSILSEAALQSSDQASAPPIAVNEFATNQSAHFLTSLAKRSAPAGSMTAEASVTMTASTAPVLQASMTSYSVLIISSPPSSNRAAQV